MYAIDFEYDGRYLSDYGFIICTFGGQSDFDTISAGSKIEFNKVSMHGGRRYGLAGSTYEECIEAEFSICKNPDIYEDLRISGDEFREMMRWLNQRNMHRFKLVDEQLHDDDCFYNASFNIDKVLVCKDLVGLNLTMITDSPFGYGNRVNNVITVTDTSEEFIISDISDDIGFLYPDVRIEIMSDGDLVIRNNFFDSITSIKNCKAGEIITMTGKQHIIQSSRESHKIYNDFNFKFIKIGNSLNDRRNVFSFSIPCKVTISYDPIIKDSPA